MKTIVKLAIGSAISLSAIALSACSGESESLPDESSQAVTKPVLTCSPSGGGPAYSAFPRLPVAIGPEQGAALRVMGLVLWGESKQPARLEKLQNGQYRLVRLSNNEIIIRQFTMGTPFEVTFGTTSYSCVDNLVPCSVNGKPLAPLGTVGTNVSRPGSGDVETKYQIFQCGLTGQAEELWSSSRY